MDVYLLYLTIGLATVLAVLVYEPWNKAFRKHLSHRAHPVTGRLPLRFCVYFVLAVATVWPMFWLAEVSDRYHGR